MSTNPLSYTGPYYGPYVDPSRTVARPDWLVGQSGPTAVDNASLSGATKQLLITPVNEPGVWANQTFTGPLSDFGVTEAPRQGSHTLAYTTVEAITGATDNSEPDPGVVGQNLAWPIGDGITAETGSTGEFTDKPQDPYRNGGMDVGLRPQEYLDNQAEI